MFPGKTVAGKDGKWNKDVTICFYLPDGSPPVHIMKGEIPAGAADRVWLFFYRIKQPYIIVVKEIFAEVPEAV